MTVERTLSIIKPDATARNRIGAIVSRLERGGLSVVAARMTRLSAADAARFYAVHCERPFFEGLMKFMTSGSIVALALEGENAIAKNREIMGATDPAQAAPGTIRADFATDIEANAVHGSDSAQTAAVELAFFFPELAGAASE